MSLTIWDQRGIVISWMCSWAESYRMVDWVFSCSLSGASVNAKDQGWLTPLHRAAASRNEVRPWCQVLYVNPSTVISLEFLISLNSIAQLLKLICILITHHLLSWMSIYMNVSDSHTPHPFYLFSFCLSQKAVGLLLKQDAEVNLRDKFWQTPLHVAAANRATRCAEALIPKLSSLNVADRSGRTALHHAAHSGHVEVRGHRVEGYE